MSEEENMGPVIGIVIIVAILFFGGWYFFFNQNTSMENPLNLYSPDASSTNTEAEAVSAPITPVDEATNTPTDIEPI